MSGGLSGNQRKCKKCGNSTTSNVGGGEDGILKCSSCGASYHGKRCLSYDDRLISVCRTYNWTCGSCKRCEVCLRKRNEKDLILCDICDRGYHCFCLVPQLWKPPKGSWRCPNCTPPGSTKENIAVARSARRSSAHLDGGPRTAVVPSGGKDDGVAATNSSDHQQQSARNRKRTQPVPHYQTRRNNQPALSSPPIKRRRLFVGTRPVKCPVEGCNSEGHISGRFPRHVYREFCPLYRGLSKEQTRELRKKREELLQQLHKTSKLELQKTDEERFKLECQLRKQLLRPTASGAAGNSSAGDHHQQEDREPSLDRYVSRFDLDMFRMAESELAEQMERDWNLRNTLSSSRNKWIRFGGFDIATWYPSQFPGEYARLEKLFVCEYCLKVMRCQYQLKRHNLPGRCTRTHPPGDKIYEKGALAVWEVDGKTDKIYCQYLCLLAMLFLDHKTLFKDVEAFYFYILTIKDESAQNTYHFVAYFSKEKTSTANCNLSCVLTLPPFLRRGYGHFLIDLSYALSKLEGKIGSPEHPLSDMGLKTYRSYWKSKIFDSLSRVNTKGATISVKDISHQTAIHQNDLISTLQYLGMVKYWRGQYWVVKTEAVHAYKNLIQKKKNDPLHAPREIDFSKLTLKRGQ